MPRKRCSYFLVAGLLLLIVSAAPLRAQAPPDPVSSLRNELAAKNGLRGSDLLFILSQQGLADILGKLVGLEIKHPSGATLRIKSAAVELKPAEALVELDIQATPAVAVTSLGLHLYGKLGSAQVNGTAIKFPFELTEVTLDKGESKGGTFLTRFFSEWLTPKKWNESLPELELPLQLSQELELPATEFDASGELPVHVRTPAYKLKLDFTVASIAILSGRAVFALNISGHDHSHGEAITANGDPLIDLEKLSAHLNTSSAAEIRFSPDAVNWLLSGLAGASDKDLVLDLSKGRLRTSELRLPVGRITSFTDISSGAGTVDIRSLKLEEFTSSGLIANLSATGRMKTRLEGKEVGIPYKLQPDFDFKVEDQRLPFELSAENGRIALKPRPDANIKFQISVPLDIAGKQINYRQNLEFRADKWLKVVELPEIFSREIELPRKLSISKDRHITVVKSEKMVWRISNLKVAISPEYLQLAGDIR